MRAHTFKMSLIKSGFAASILLLASSVCWADSVNLTAAPTQAALPDGQTVPMWGYSCGAVVDGSSATCAASNPNAGGNWSPVVITVPLGTSLTINLTNNLSFTVGSGSNTVPTSLVIVGQLGGGLGDVTQRTTMPSPVHAPQGTTWPGTQGTTNPGDPVFTPPAQAARVRSFGTEVAAGATTALTWNNLRPGTYLIESGTQPSIQGPMGLYGMLVVTDPAYPGQAFDKDVALLLSEIDPVQNTAVDTAVRTAGFSDALVWNGQTGKCGDPTVHTCYPPAVNYDPLYYLINGVSFDRSNLASSALAVPAATVHGRVLLRFVNAGLRMHVPSVVNANMTLLAEDGNKLPGVPKVQSALFLAAGKSYDVTIQPKQITPGTYDAATYPVFDRQLSLSTNNQRDGGMQAHINVAGGGAAGSVGSAASSLSAVANPDSYFLVAGNVLAVAEVARGVIANDTAVYGVKLQTGPTGVGSTLSLNADGTFTYTPGAGVTTDSFSYCGNGATSGALCTTVTLAACGSGCLGAVPMANADSYSSDIASRLQISPPGVLLNDTDPSGHPLKASAPSDVTGGTVTLNPDGSFVAMPTTAPTGTGTATVTFHYQAVNSQNTSSALATATVTFKGGSGITIAVQDAKNGGAINDYRWIIEEDRSVWIEPKCQVNTGTNPRPSGCPPLPVQSIATNFHTSHMPVVATGCVGPVSCEAGQTLLGEPAVCDIGNGACRTADATTKAEVNPSQVALDPTKRYYISIMPGDGVNPTIGGAGGPMTVDGKDVPFDIARDCGPYTGTGAWEPGGADALCGHGMGGAQIAAGQTTSVTVNLQQSPLPTAKISVFVFQDDRPLNGESDAGGGVNTLAPNEPGLGGFNIVLLDAVGGLGDSTGQLTYDEFGQPVSNALAGYIDPATRLDACPISKASTDRLVGIIETCPKYESDGVTLSPLAGHAVIANMYPGLYEVVATPGSARIARGEEWLQTNTLDGTKAIEAFIKADEPAYFQEFGPGGYHIAVGFANPKLINDRKAAVCVNQACTATINGVVTNARMSRTPDQRVYSSGDYASYSFTQCYVSLGAPDGDDFAFTKCNPDGTFTFSGIPRGNLKVTVFDQWNDLLVDGLSTPIKVDSDSIGTPTQPLEIAVTQWRTNLYGRVFLDKNGDGVSQEDEPGLPLVPFNIRYRDGSYMGFNNTDLAGYAGFNEVFPFLNWLVVDTDSARYKQTGIHVVYDAGGPVDGTTGAGSSNIAAGLANTIESPTAHVPMDQRIPGARYCLDADCTGTGSFNPASGNPGSTGRVDPGWVPSEGWQGLLGQNSFIEFAMKPFLPGENGGIRGHVLYTPTRPFDDPALLLQLSWAPGVPNVTVNLYQKGTAPDGTKSLKLVDTTKSSSWDDWAQGFRSDGKPNMSCPGQETTSPFYFTMENSTQWLNPTTPIAAHSQFKCYDGWSMLNQVQPAPYNGMYKFPSIIGRNPVTGVPTGVGSLNGMPAPRPGSNCTICVANPDDGTPMLPPGKYVVEVIVPSGYELVKEEDKNILLGDVYIAPVTQQFAGFGNIFIMPDQAAMNAAYNPKNAIQSTTNNGAVPRREGDTGSVEVFWPCVGATRIVPDYNSLFPGAGQAAPFAGASRPLCDRKEITLDDQMTALAKFYVFTSAHVTAHFAGTITNDFASEFDPFSPQFGEKFAVPNVPVAFRDFAGKEVARVYADQWGYFNGLNYSTWTVNPPSPSGYIPQMMIACMNDPGPIPGPDGTMITDPMYNPGYSNFCYEWSFMPGQTAYMDTPVLPTMAFADRYNLPDCEYPDTTPAIKSVLGTASGGGRGPWVSAAGQPLTINALGDKIVLNHAYSGPQASTAPFNQKLITRHYGFGARPSTCPTSGTCSNVTIGGVPMTNVTTWTDSQIVGNVPNLSPSQSTCTIAQRTTPTSLGMSARCGQLVITAANGKQSIDTVTVTVAGKPPVYVNGENGNNNALQTAIDSAAPGDLIIVGPGTYKENLLMWKPVRLQGVGATSVTINADAHPAGKMEPWRRQVNCLFGLTLDGRPLSEGPYDSTGTYSCSTAMAGKVDRNNREGIIGWDVTTNGNLAQLLQEPTLMGAYEGAGITVLGKGVRYPAGEDPFAIANAGAFPAGTVYLTGSNSDCSANTSNFECNPSRIDGISVINSSQGGGGIFLHGWNHNMEIANNRIYANHGTLSGGIAVGAGEFTAPYIAGGAEPIPFDFPNNTPDGTQLGYGMNTDVRVHHNAVTNNASIGDALYSGTPSAAGGVSFCSGADNYLFNYNWVCGNLSTGDGGGVSHIGFSNDGTIAHNTIIFNQSASPTIPTNGGGLAILGASPDRTLTTGPNAGQECGTTNDLDCPPGLPEGTGRNLVVDANLIMGNSAESGTGGGLRLQMVNGDDVAAFPDRPDQVLTGPPSGRSPGWNSVTVTNNIISNNVAGWDGGGVSIQDALKVRFINNTVISNDTTASAGVLFNTLGAPMAAVPPPGCTPQPDPTLPQDPSCDNPVKTSTNQAAGLVTMSHTPNLLAALPADTGGTQVRCPSGYGYGSTAAALDDGSCRNVSLPLLSNNLFWQNRAFHIEVGDLGSGHLNQQKVVTLVPSLNQTATGFCAAAGTENGAPGSNGPAYYWDIGVRGDTGPANHDSSFTLSPNNSILTSLSGGYSGNGNLAPSSPEVVKQYCNGSRLPPENGGHGYSAPPGRSETTGLYPVFALNQITPAATVDEGNNWINLSYGPLAMSNPASYTTPGLALPALGDYSIKPASPAVNAATGSGAPNRDYFGTTRPQGGGFDIGAVEIVLPPAAIASVTGGPLSFGNVPNGATSTSQTLTLRNTGTANLTGITLVFSSPRYSRAGGTCGATLTPATGTCTINVVFKPIAAGLVNATLTITGNVSVTGSPVSLSGTGIAPVISAALTPATQSFGTVIRGTSALTAPIRTFTLTNTGNVTLTGIASPTITLNGTNYFIVPLLTTCGTVNPLNTPLTRITSLAPSGTCFVTVQFRPPLSDTANSAQNGTVRITAGAAGAQTSSLSGTAQ